ncbi:hypothetical protein SPI_01048 [Niveomyces insectorum RCEF 264]|uniref:Uncharacterized protein n=1 Tax=Niveomyces insectorum RCEF 264 TaxID=1081102 RepID=A0A162JBB8_9HYPO|nr:hypothetical protein SPI_01048 [Niveomyces insectorum RCEF 264]
MRRKHHAGKNGHWLCEGEWTGVPFGGLRFSGLYSVAYEHDDETPAAAAGGGGGGIQLPEAPPPPSPVAGEIDGRRELRETNG